MKRTPNICLTSKKPTITSLSKPDGSNVIDGHGLLKEQVNYYKSLYERDTKVDPIAYDVFKESIDVKKLSNENRLGCEGKLTRIECFEVVKDAK